MLALVVMVLRVLVLLTVLGLSSRNGGEFTTSWDGGGMSWWGSCCL